MYLLLTKCVYIYMYICIIHGMWMYGLDFWRGARPVDSLSTARLEFGLKLCWVQKCVCMSAKYPVRSRRDLSCMYDSVPMCQSRVAHLELSTFHWVRNHRPLPRPQNTHPKDYTLSKQARFAQTQQVYTYTYFKYATSVKRVCMNRMLILFFKFSLIFHEFIAIWTNTQTTCRYSHTPIK